MNQFILKKRGINLKIHEYQAKNILKKYQVPIQDGYTTEKKEDIASLIKKACKAFKTSSLVIKAQIHAGGRGKGGGVKFCKNEKIALEKANEILGMHLMTPQTGKEGKLVKKIMIGEAIDIDKEYYLAITLDREQEKNVIMVSTEGGVEIEEVAKNTPKKIIKEWVDPKIGLRSFQSRRLGIELGFEEKLLKSFIKILSKIYQCYKVNDTSLLEINPFVLTKQGGLIALDAKFNFDENALSRQKEIASLRDLDEEDPTEIEANKYHLNFIKLDGNVSCMVNGAGLAMATMDIIKLKGGQPANFLDIGGGASAETVENAFKIILSDSSVKAVLINIFGGIVRCDRVASGIISAAKNLKLTVPIVVRLEGTNADLAKELFAKSSVPITATTSLDEAASKVVSLVS